MNGRNQRCSCGSGKKAKFCCRKSKPIRPLPNETDRREAETMQIMYRKFVEEFVSRVTEHMRKALAPIPEGSYRCCRCGKIEQFTTPREEMLEELHRIFGPDAKPEDCGIACDECWEHIKPERNPEQYSKFLAEQTNQSTND